MKKSEELLVTMLVQRALDSYGIYGKPDQTDPCITLSKHPAASQEVMDATVAKLQEHGFTVEIGEHFDPTADDARACGPGWDKVPRWLYGDPGGAWDADLHGYIVHTRFPRFLAIVDETTNDVKALWIDQPTEEVNVAALLTDAYQFYCDFTDNPRNPENTEP
jgi:hypothetical protein